MSDLIDPSVDELRQKLRMIISHASGGHLSEPGDIDRSTNDICVEISRHNNRIWQHAQETALASSPQANTEEVIERACFSVNPNVDEQTLVYAKAVARAALQSAPLQGDGDEQPRHFGKHRIDRFRDGERT